MDHLKVASVQFTHLPGDKQGNLDIIENFVKDAAEENVKLICFPEMCITGYWHLRDFNADEIDALSEHAVTGASAIKLLEWSKQYDMSIGAGIIEKADDGKFYNTFLVAMSNGNLVSHRKIHCFINENMDSGDQYTVFETPEGCKVGILICYDNNIIENVRATALLGAEILLSPHQTGGCKSPSPFCMGEIDVNLWQNRKENPEAIENEFKGTKGREWLRTWLPARAHDNGMCLLFSNGVGQDDNEVRTGNAMILGCYGQTLAETWEANNKMVIATLDLTEIKSSTGRRWIKTRRPELYSSLTEVTGSEEDTRKVRFDFEPQS